MRLARALLFVGLTAVTAPAALADEAKPADPKPEVATTEGGGKVPLRVVRMLPETHQVLLYDRNRGTHVAAEVGQDVDGFIVDEIDGDEVTLVAPSGAEVILTAPDMSWRRRAAERRAARSGKAAAAAPAAAAASRELGPVDPYADPASPGAPAPAGGASAATAASPATPAATSPATPAPTSAAAPLTAGEGGVRVASATGDAAAIVPADPYAQVEPGITAFADAVGASSPAGAPATPAPASRAVAAPETRPDAKVDAAAGLAAAATGSPAAAAPASPASNAATFTVARGEVDAALADFGATAVTFDAAFVTGGLRFDHIAKGTILAKLGLQDGDVLASVDNQPVRSLDDAASLYARAGTTKAATLYVVRGGKPVALKVTIR